jgi:hypothetical protein
VLRHKINKSRVESYEEILCKQYRRKGEKNLFFVFFIIPRNIFLNQKIFQPFPTLFHVCAANALSMCTKEERRSLKVYVFHSTHFSKISHESTPFRMKPRLIAEFTKLWVVYRALSWVEYKKRKSQYSEHVEKVLYKCPHTCADKNNCCAFCEFLYASSFFLFTFSS